MLWIAGQRPALPLSEEATQHADHHPACAADRPLLRQLLRRPPQCDQPAHPCGGGAGHPLVGSGPAVVPAATDYLVPVRHLVGVRDVQRLVLLQQAVAPAGHRHAHPVLRVRLPVPPAGGRDRPAQPVLAGGGRVRGGVAS
ncbi:hypothetical protein G6F68_018277 [Rhizopus microsporus]|nr:hypothetical protein G6F68_018277 [Rhizopus microsporus]